MIEVRNLTKRYGSNRGVRNLDFMVRKGEILGFLGPNGAGKSTTMNMITGYKPPTEGKVIIDGLDMAESPLQAKRKIGYLPEIPPLYPDLKVISYLRFVCGLKGVNPGERENHIRKIMDQVKISDVKDRLIKNLSKGYRQRVGLAQALISNPEILILDEPTAGLDPKQISEMRSLIRGLGEEHTILLSSHILAEVSMICGRVIILNKGEIAAIGTPGTLADGMALTEKFVARIKAPKEKVLDIVKGIDGIVNITAQDIAGTESEKEDTAGFSNYIIENRKVIDVKTPLFFAMAGSGFPIHELRPLDISLEDIFLRLTAESGNELGEVQCL